MKKIIIAAITIMAATSAMAQTTSTVYGHKVDNNFNLRFTEAEKVHTEITLGAHVSGGDYTAEGASLTLRRQYKVASYGVQVSSEYSKEYKVANSTAFVGGLRLGSKTVSFGIDGLLGYGQSHELVESAKGEATHEYKTSHWKPFVGVQASLNFRLSGSVMLSVYGGYKHSFISNGDHSLAMSNGWEVTSQTNDANRWFAGASLSFLLNQASQISGDNCWQAEAFGGYSNAGALAGVKALHFKRTSAKVGRVLGFGTQYTMDKFTSNEVFGQAGFRFLPRGAKSPIVWDVYATAGIGQFAKTAQGATEDGKEFRMGSEIYAIGGAGRIHAGVSYHKGRFSIGAEGFAGYYVSAGTTFEGNHGYQGATQGTNGALYGGVVKVALSF